MPRDTSKRISAGIPLSEWVGPFGVHFTLVVRDALFWDICGELLRFCERSNKLVVNVFVVGFSFLLEHELRIQKESTFFWNISCTPLLFCPAPAKAMMASRGSGRSPVGFGALVGATLACGSEASAVLLRSLFLQSTAGCSVSASAPSCLSRLISLRVRGMCILARDLKKQSCGPVLPTFCWLRSCSTNESFRGFAGRSSGRQGTLFFGLRLHGFLFHASLPSVRSGHTHYAKGTTSPCLTLDCVWRASRHRSSSPRVGRRRRVGGELDHGEHGVGRQVFQPLQSDRCRLSR